MEKLKDQKADKNLIVKESYYDLSLPHIMTLGDYKRAQEKLEQEIDKADDLAEGLFNGLAAVNADKAERLKADRDKANEKVKNSHRLKKK